MIKIFAYMEKFPYICIRKRNNKTLLIYCKTF
nr:MAG TPA: hypothetical protein [Caudoviricetes sp.]